MVYSVHAYVNSYLPTESNRTTYPDLLYYLKDFSDWQALGAHILPGNSEELIQIIYTTHEADVQECKKNLFFEYLKAGDRSWSTVIAALIKIGNKALASDIHKRIYSKGIHRYCACSYIVHYGGL